MPSIVTDADVLAEIATTDALATGLDGAIGSLAATIPDDTRAQWTAFLAGYRAWAKAATANLSGGFLAGAWFGVPELGDQAIAYGVHLNEWQAFVNALAGRTIAPVGTTPLAVADQNALLPLPGGGLSTGVVLGVVGLAVLLLVVRR